MIQSIEQALQDMGDKLPGLADHARAAVASGDSYEVTVTVQTSKSGAVVTMHSTQTSARESHGRLIRLD